MQAEMSLPSRAGLSENGVGEFKHSQALIRF